MRALVSVCSPAVVDFNQNHTETKARHHFQEGKGFKQHPKNYQWTIQTKNILPDYCWSNIEGGGGLDLLMGK